MSASVQRGRSRQGSSCRVRKDAAESLPGAGARRQPGLGSPLEGPWAVGPGTGPGTRDGEREWTAASGPEARGGNTPPGASPARPPPLLTNVSVSPGHQAARGRQHGAAGRPWAQAQPCREGRGRCLPETVCLSDPTREVPECAHPQSGDKADPRGPHQDGVS